MSNPVAIAQITEAALETIHKLTGIGGDKAGEALAAIRGIIEKLRDGTSCKLPPQVVLSSIESLHAGVASNAAAFRSEVDARFGK